MVYFELKFTKNDVFLVKMGINGTFRHFLGIFEKFPYISKNIYEKISKFQPRFTFFDKLENR